MNSDRKLKLNLIIFLFIFSPIFGVSLNYFNDTRNNSGYSNDFTLDKGTLKLSDVSGKIHIDNNWTDAKAAGICTGNGTYSEPYVIEDLIIDGGESGSCVLIENSNVSFIIRNCSVFNAGFSGKGFYLLNVNNSQLIDNNANDIRGDDGYGIFLIGDNNLIVGNTVANSSIVGGEWGNGCAISLSGNNNTVYANIVINYRYSEGIRIYGSNSKINGNTISNNGLGHRNSMDYMHSGLEINGNNNNVSGNVLIKNPLSLKGYSHTLSGNIINNSGLITPTQNIGELSSHNIDTTNLINGHPLYYYSNKSNLVADNFTNAGQIILVNCNDSSLKNLKISYTTTFRYFTQYYIEQTVAMHDTSAISLFYCNNNTISENTLYNNTNGIFLYKSSKNTILENIGYDNFDGIILTASDDNKISGNNFFSNIEYGFILSGKNNKITYNEANYNGDVGVWWGSGMWVSGIDCNVSGNEMYHNDYRGLALSCSYTYINENIVNNNFHGIYLSSSSSYNIITKNTANVNQLGIMLTSSFMSESSSNIFSENTANYNLYGIHIEGSNNQIIQNTLIQNSYGIYLYGSDSNWLSTKYNNVTGNIINLSSTGIRLYQSDSNTVSGNYFSGNTICITEEDCESNYFSDNSGCSYGQENPTPSISGYNILLLLSILSVVSLIISKKMKKS